MFRLCIASILSLPICACLRFLVLMMTQNGNHWSVQDCCEGFRVKNVRVCVSYFDKIICDFLLENLPERQSIRISWALFCLPLKGSICTI